ncbi:MULTISPECIES: glycosyltransferase [Streptococcus]|uniref:glycosyltransferase n=1 Tax=Streptococcus TaxID=1301 RepID=UPI00201A8F17|nr:glycosyltransferase [Streptococcus suis]MCL4922345.1 glycosyltransferase [Streptococcus suis]HEM6145515.1 glycosyltransferase [Streptococcus suis]HEM6363745.1 glycosyltransferase [Streptococcus suis]HEM6403597.1 glycosyltransferase [Streptococcus suis]
MKVTIVNCFDTYEHRVELLKTYFEKRGAIVSVFASDYRHFQKEYRVDCKKDYKFIHARSYKKNFSYSRLKSHWKLSKDIFREIDQNIDLLWVLVPPNSFVKEAAKYKKANPTVTLIFDIIDMWPETMPMSVLKQFFPFTLWGDLRNHNLSIADFVVTECDLYQTKLSKYVDITKMKTLYLARENKPLLIPIEGELSSKHISICYLGSINNIIDLSAIKSILASFSKVFPTKFHIIGDGEKKEELLSMLEELPIEVVNHGKVFEAHQKNAILQSCHFGLNVMKQSVFVGLTMKSMDYFEAGLPIINTIQGDTAQFVSELGIGLNVFDEEVDFSSYTYDLQMRAKVRQLFETYFTVEAFESCLDQIMIGIEKDEKIKL